ncbi:uncharacterized protein MELLADRAFT_74153, partial [Melampsora larici-populina 98AG31]
STLVLKYTPCDLSICSVSLLGCGIFTILETCPNSEFHNIYPTLLSFFFWHLNILQILKTQYFSTFPKISIDDLHSFTINLDDDLILQFTCSNHLTSSC